MKKTGYTPEEAAAIETAASTGGQIMPPVMGTAAFILAETVGVPYITVCMVSIIPAILYYASIYFLVDTKAKKRGLKGLSEDEVPKLSTAIRQGGIFFVPIIVLITLLAFNYTPFLSGVACAFMILLFAQLRKSTRISIKSIALALESCARSMCSIAGVIYCACIIISMINITGLMMKTTAIILSISGGKVWLTVLLIAGIAYVMGMGLPIATSYIILSTLAGPALIELGVPAICAHLAIFWFTQLSGITPPVCMTAFAAASIAKGNPMKTGFTALIFGMTFYYVPILFIYSDLIGGTWPMRLLVGTLAFIAIYFLGTFTEAYFLGDMGKIQRFSGLIIFLMIYVAMFNGTNFIVSACLCTAAVALMLVNFVIQRNKAKKYG